MSSRALRRAQKEREKAEVDAQLQDEEGVDSEDDALQQSKAKPSVFAMLGGDDDDDDDGHDDHDLEQDVEHAAHNDKAADDDEEGVHSDHLVDQKPSNASKRKKKKKKNKIIAEEGANAAQTKSADDVDEIDAALRSLRTSDAERAKESLPSYSEEAELCSLLAVDTQHLQVANEMKRLFGKAAFDSNNDSETPRDRREMQYGESATLSEIVAGKNAVGGAGLTAMLRRRNIFVQGKEEWPRVTANGLSMEVVERRPGGVTEYKFVHNQQYQMAQRQFATCVASMDVTLMVNLLRENPYNISTLLQVSEVAKQERDHSTAGDLLERALFAFGRASHSTFATSLTQGKARLDFRRPENREFWLAAWRYIGNISMRATWRTAYEWARLLLSLDPNGDPYCVRLVIDQFALRAKMTQNFLDLSNSRFFRDREWSMLPNIAYSKGLAERILEGDASQNGRLETNSKRVLMEAIQDYPWIAGRLLKELEVDKTPAAVWGQLPKTDSEVLYTELYVTMALDIWKIPDAKSFLGTVASHTSSANVKQTMDDTPISIDEARHVVLTDKPPLIGLLPHDITSKINSTSDPLPPADDLTSYNASPLRPPPPQQRPGSNPPTAQPFHDLPDPRQVIEADGEMFVLELLALQRYFETRGRHAAQPGPEPRTVLLPLPSAHFDAIAYEQVDEILRSQAIDEEQRPLFRLALLWQALREQPERRVHGRRGRWAQLVDDGAAVLHRVPDEQDGVEVEANDDSGE